MARTSKQAQTEEAAELRSQMWKHELFVEWAASEGVDLSAQSAAEVIAYFAARRNAFRATDLYRKAVENHRGEAEAAKAQRAELRAKAAKEAKATKAATKAPAKATKQAAKAPAKKTAAKRGGKTAATSTDDSPFD